MTRVDKHKALQLRLEGKTYSDIQKVLGPIAKSTLSLWLKDAILSEETKRILASRAKEKSLGGILRSSKKQTMLSRRNAEIIRRENSQDIKNLSRRDLMILVAGLYWAEGYKRPRSRNGREVMYHEVSLTNSDPKLAKAFLEGMVRLCRVEILQVKASIRIFEHMNEYEAVEYWSNELGIPKNNFTKTYKGISKSSMGKRPFNRLPHGIIQIRINNTNLFNKIMGWIEGIKMNV